MTRLTLLACAVLSATLSINAFAVTTFQCNLHSNDNYRSYVIRVLYKYKDKSLHKIFNGHYHCFVNTFFKKKRNVVSDITVILYQTKNAKPAYSWTPTNRLKELSRQLLPKDDAMSLDGHTVQVGVDLNTDSPKLLVNTD